MANATLVLMANEIRGKTLRLLDGVTEEQGRFAALNNSILWHAGHALVVVEHLGVAPLNGGKVSYPEGYFDSFSWKSNPAAVTSWPALAEVRTLLAEQLTRLAAVLEQTPAAQFDQITDPQRGKTLRWSILHGLHDEANHQGEIYLLKKLMARQGVTDKT